MTNLRGWKSRIRGAAALAAASAALCWAALWNGYPLVWPDTGGYIYPVNLVFRSVFYNFLVAPLTWAAGSLWPIVFFQSLVVAYLLRLILLDVFGDGSPRRLLAVTLGVAVLTSLPWETGFVMADVYAPVVVLALFLLAFCAETLSRRERLLLSAILLAACAVHLTHPLIAAGLLTLFAGLRWATRKRPAWPAPRLVGPAIPVALSVALLSKQCHPITVRCSVRLRLHAGAPGRRQASSRFPRETCPVGTALCDPGELLDGSTAFSDRRLRRTGSWGDSPGTGWRGGRSSTEPSGATRGGSRGRRRSAGSGSYSR
jgi:hypothetical protein